MHLYQTLCLLRAQLQPVGHTGGKCGSLAPQVLMQLLSSSRPGPKPDSTG